MWNPVKELKDVIDINKINVHSCYVESGEGIESEYVIRIRPVAYPALSGIR